MFPAYRFDALLNLPQDRSACGSFALPVSPGLGDIATANPFPIPVLQSRSTSGSPLPFRAFWTPLDRSVWSGHWSKGSPSVCVCLPFAPRRLLYWYSYSGGSTFQARFASGRLAVPRTSWNQVLWCLRIRVTVKWISHSV